MQVERREISKRGKLISRPRGFQDPSGGFFVFASDSCGNDPLENRASPANFLLRPVPFVVEKPGNVSEFFPRFEVGFLSILKEILL